MALKSRLKFIAVLKNVSTNLLISNTVVEATSIRGCKWNTQVSDFKFYSYFKSSQMPCLIGAKDKETENNITDTPYLN